MRRFFAPGPALELCILLFAFFLPFARSGVSLFAVFILLLWPFAAGKEKIGAIFSLPATRAILAYTGFVALSLLWTEHLDTGLQNFKNSGHLLLIPIVAVTLSKKSIQNTLLAFGAGLLIHLFAGYLGLFVILPKSGGSLLPEPVYFMNRLDYVFLLTLTGIFTLNHLLYEKKLTKESWVFIFFTVACIGTIFQLHARIAFIMLAAGLLLVPFFRFEGKQRIIAAFSTALVLAAVFTASFTFNEKFRKITRNAYQSILLIQENAERQYTTSWGQRIIAIKGGIEIFQESPIIGKGVGDNIYALQDYLKKKAAESQVYAYTYEKATAIKKHFHNQYIETLTQTGLVGLTLMLVMFFTFWQMRPEERAWNSFTTIFLAILSLGFIAEPYMQKQFPSALIALTTGLLLAQKQIESGQTPIAET